MQIADLEVFNHAVSAKKFRIIQMFLELGYNVLLSDIDIIVLRVLPLFPSMMVSGENTFQKMTLLMCCSQDRKFVVKIQTVQSLNLQE